MRDAAVDNGLIGNGLTATAWALGVVAFASLIRLLAYASDDAPLQAEVFAWMLTGMLASVFSACCAVLVGVKAAEQRLSQHMDSSRT